MKNIISFSAALYCFFNLGILGLYAQTPAKTRVYNPQVISPDTEINETLSEYDIPTGKGGFARDYYIQLDKGDQIAIDLISDDFDAVLILLASDGSTVAENDDAPDGSTNALIFARITEAGKYFIRVTAFGETGNGRFNLKLTRLQSVSDSESKVEY